MKRVFTTAFGAVAALAAMTTTASAEICLLVIGLGGGSGDSGGGVPAAPEIDVAQGFAALAVLAVAMLLLRERFLRAKR